MTELQIVSTQDVPGDITRHGDDRLLSLYAQYKHLERRLGVLCEQDDISDSFDQRRDALCNQLLLRQAGLLEVAAREGSTSERGVLAKLEMWLAMFLDDMPGTERRLLQSIRDDLAKTVERMSVRR